MSHTGQQNKFHRLLGKITRPRNPSKNRQQTKIGNAAENNPQTSSTAVNPTSILDEPHEVSLPRSSVSTLVGDSKNPVVAPQFDIPSKSASIHKALWEKAYSNLRSDKKKVEYVTTYEQLLSTVLLNQKIADQGLGEDQMKEIIAHGLKKIEKYKKAVDYSEDKLEAVKAIKSIIEIPLSNIPQTALPWAIISSTIDIFLKPLEVGAEFYNGVGYVVGRIEWYSRFTDQLLSQSSFRNESPLGKIRADIETSITNLYRSLLFYQIKSVCCFYQRHQILVLVRGALRFDNWKGDLDDIKAAEKALRESCDFYSLECLKGQVRELSMRHDIQEKVDTFYKRLQARRHVDPKSIAGTIYKRKEMPIADLYEWIFETDVFKAFAKWGDEDADCGPTIILIDALDECEEVSRRSLASFLEEKLDEEELSHVKWLITSRPIWDLKHSRLSGNAPEKHSLLVLDDHNLSRWINAYISQKMASLVIREFGNSPEKNWKGILDRIPGDLHKLYDLLFEKLHDPDCKNVLAVAMLANRPLTLPEIEQLSGLESGINAGRDTVTLCGSFLALRDETVYLIHQSAHDCSIKGLKKALEQNIYDLTHFGILTKDVRPPIDDPLSPIRYGCQYWVHHLKESKFVQPGGILDFLRAHLLHWFEAMALLGLLPEILQIVAELLLLEGPHSRSELSDFLLDSKRFIQMNLPAVTLAPLHLYVSALIFTPMDSLVRRTGSIPKWIEKPPVVEKSWRCLLQTFELPDNVKSMAFSPNDKLLAGIDGRNIKIWDTATGVLKRELIHKYSKQNTRYGNSLQCIGFSSDGRNLVSTADSGEIQMWETETWRPTQRLMHSGSDIIEHAIVSPDNQMLASGSKYGTIKVWQKETDTWKLKWAFSSSGDLSFSPNSLLLAANKHERIDIWNLETATVAWDDKVKVWDTGASALIHTIEDMESVPLTTMVFSPDNKILAWGGREGYVTVHNIQNKEPIVQRGTIISHGAHVTEIQFSRSSRLVAAASKLPRVEVWDTETGRLVTQEDQNLEGEELQDFIESWEINLQLNANTTVDCNVSYEMAEPSCKFDISIIDDWIVIGLERSIWLPPERRPEWKSAFEQCNNIFVLATQGGQPLIFWFNPDAMSAKQLQVPVIFSPKSTPY
ncbi:hypothetical protein ZTR_01592 [Talaromyces verruculosus]|nr:hypothetical protein ZTR_01592 [Talaromyces verruculosus]